MRRGPQNDCIASSQKSAKGDLIVGHRGDPRVRVACRNTTALKIPTVATDQPADAKSSAVAPAGRSQASYTATGDAIRLNSNQDRIGSGGGEDSCI